MGRRLVKHNEIFCNTAFNPRSQLRLPLISTPTIPFLPTLTRASDGVIPAANGVITRVNDVIGLTRARSGDAIEEEHERKRQKQ